MGPLLLNSVARLIALSMVRLAITMECTDCSRMGAMMPLVAPPAPRISTLLAAKARDDWVIKSVTNLTICVIANMELVRL